MGTRRQRQRRITGLILVLVGVITLGLIKDRMIRHSDAEGADHRRTSSAFPDATSTGVPNNAHLISVPAQATSGKGWHWDGTALVIESDDVTLASLDVAGAVHNTHARLTVRDTRIRCIAERDWCLTLGSGSELSDSEIGGGESGHELLPAIGVLSGDFREPSALTRIERVNIHHTIHGMRIDGDTSVADSYLHDFPMGDAPYTDAHTDAIMCTAGSNVTVRHNRIASGNNALFFVQWQPGNVPIADYVVEGNLFEGTARNQELSSFGVKIEAKGIGGTVLVHDNLFAGVFQVGDIMVPGQADVRDNQSELGTPASIQFDK